MKKNPGGDYRKISDPADMVEILLRNEELLRPNDLEWIQRMDETVSNFDDFDGFTERQTEVIVEIFRRYFPI